MERLSKYVARTSSFSRRKAEELIRAGKVKVNKAIVLEPFRQIEPTDVVLINNQSTELDSVKFYIALYKPDGYMSDLLDSRERKLARSLIKIDVKLYPVGRLDYHSEGLMIFTNDGNFANEVMHPRYEIEKEYMVKFKGLLTKDEIDRVRKGIKIDFSAKDFGEQKPKSENARKPRGRTPTDGKPGITEEFCKVDYIKLVHSATKNGWYRVKISQGKNRMIRRIGEAIGHPVLKLKRIRIGKLLLGDLRPGEYRYFEKKEVFGAADRAKEEKHGSGR